MPMFSIFDGRTSFYQWDLGQRLIVRDDVCCEVHFDNGTTENALVCKVFSEDGQRLVNVPNIFLQCNNLLKVFAYVESEGCQRTSHIETFMVIQRAKPDDYVYTETEVWTAEKAVAEALEEAKASGDFKGEKGDKGEPGEPGPKGDPGDENVVILEYGKETFAEAKAAYEDGKFLVLRYKKYQLPMYDFDGITFTFKASDTGYQQNCWLQETGWGSTFNQLVTHKMYTELEERVDALEEDFEGVDKIVEGALEEAKASGDFKGEKGDPGEQGSQGPAGPQGAPGENGIIVLKTDDAGAMVLQENTYYQIIGGSEKKKLTFYNSDNSVGYSVSYQVLTIYCGSMMDSSNYAIAQNTPSAMLFFIGNDTGISALTGAATGTFAFKKNFADGTPNTVFRAEVEYPTGTTIVMQTGSPNALPPIVK